MQSYRMLLMLLFLAGCSPQNSLHSIVNRHNYKPIAHQSDFFHHVVYVNSAFYLNEVPTLYVFLEGDGIPWKTRTQISANPQPVYPLALDLMTQNKYPGVYLQRPCYGVKEINCHFQWWTNKRYSQEVVSSMLQVLDKVSENYLNVTLVGYSGGGGLATLMARKSDKVSKLITLAGNLDHQKWTNYHDYSSLQGSLNPINYVLPSTVQQFHFAGQKDLNILPQWVEAFSDKQINSQFILLKNVDHRCCWLENWPRIIDQTNKTVIK